jgi:Flp pilus assembly protein TadG
MTPTNRRDDLVFRLRAFARGRSGAAAVEFAALLPFMLAVYIGGVEVGDGIAIDRKVAITTRAVTDLTTQYTAIYASDMSNILGASSAVLAPYSSAPLAITVSEISTKNGTSTVLWSYTQGGTALTFGSTVTLPSSLATLNLNGSGTAFTLILGQVTYAYTPTLGYVLTGTWNLTDQIYLSPRDTGCISRPDDASALACPST